MSKVADVAGNLKPGQTPDPATLQKLQKLATSIDTQKLTAGVAEHHRLGREELQRLTTVASGTAPRRGRPRFAGGAAPRSGPRSGAGTRTESAGKAGRPATSAQTVIAMVAPSAATIASHVQPGRRLNRTAAAR